jgi:hypothetical protein
MYSSCKAGAVATINLARREAVEVVGEISDRDIGRAKRLGGQKFGAVKTQVGEASWQQLIFPRKIVADHARARARGQARLEDPSAVGDARYDSDADAIVLAFKGGGSMSIPRGIVPSLERASALMLGDVVVSPAGDALSWPSLDVDVYVPGLVDRAFGTRLFAASTGSRGGRRRSKAKAGAAKANGAKGGRPRKRLIA